MPALSDWLLTPQRVAIHRPTATAVVADLHLGYDRARCQTGEAIPIRDSDRVLVGLQSALARHGVSRLVIAGDVFEHRRYSDEIADVLAWFDRAGIELTGLVPGNHDGQGDQSVRKKRDQTSSSKGSDPFFSERSRLRSPWRGDGVRLGAWRVVHGDGRLPRGKVVHGHFHPCLRWKGMAAPCYLVGEHRLVLPAFSSDAAGGNVLGVPIWRTYRCFAIAGDEVLDFGRLGELHRRLRRGTGAAPQTRKRISTTSSGPASSRGSSRSC